MAEGLDGVFEMSDRPPEALAAVPGEGFPAAAGG